MKVLIYSPTFQLEILDVLFDRLHFGVNAIKDRSVRGRLAYHYFHLFYVLLLPLYELFFLLSFLAFQNNLLEIFL